MKLLTLNCHSWQEENQLDKIKYLAKTIVEKDYDIIALQEVSQLKDTERVYDNLRTDNFGLILQNEISALGKDYYLMWDYSHIGFDIYEEGLAILTKAPMINKESFYITNSSAKDYWRSRNIVCATVNFQGKEIDIYSCHLGWWHDEEEPFKNQVDNLVNRLDNNKLSLLMGDFNNTATIRDGGYDYLLGKGLIDTYNIAEEKDNGTTIIGEIAGWEGNKIPLRIDLILSNRGLDIRSSKVIFNGDNKEIVSDHYGVETELIINS